MPHPLRFRQIHLDFHTSERIAGIGSAFDPDAFAETLARAHVNSVTCFARCHHGWLYYDSKLHPDRVHPHLTRNLLAEQIAACHARGIRVPVYTTIQWDYLTACEHPEWLTRDADGRPIAQAPLKPGFYGRLAVNSPYLDFLKAHVRDILATVPVDGFFFDIVAPVADVSRWSVVGMEQAGLDPTDPEACRAYGFEVMNTFRHEMTAFVRQLNPDCTIFYNQGHVGPQHRAVVEAFTHWELESLPSGGWGYLHFPVTVRFARTLGLDLLSHTGKFHTSWGDFHSFKNLAALQFECFRMLAQGAKCLIGDQLPPDGALDAAVYDLVGRVYGEVEEKEPWCEGATPVVEIGVFTPEEFAEIGPYHVMPPEIMGVTRMLEEAGHQFNIIDSQSDLTPYRLLVLPDRVPVSAALAARLDAYLAQGGSVIASFESGLNAARDAFAWQALGVRLAGEGPRDSEGRLARGRHYPQGDFAEYILPEGAMGKGLPPTEHVMYMRGMAIEAAPGTSVLASIVPSYFDRRYDWFCSHRQTPSVGEKGQPAIVRCGQVIYFSSPIFAQYQRNAPRWCKTLFLNALDLLLPEPLVRHSGPSTMQVALNEQPIPEQPETRRWVLHLLHYVPERRGEDFDIIEDVIPLYGIELSVKVPGRVRQITLEPGGVPLAYAARDGRTVFTVPEVRGHQMIALTLG